MGNALLSVRFLLHSNRVAGTWGYFPWQGDGPLDNRWHVLDQVDRTPAWEELERQLDRIERKEGLDRLHDEWAWLGTLYVVADSLNDVPRYMVQRALNTALRMQDDPLFREWASSWKIPSQVISVHRLVVNDLQRALRQGDVLNPYALQNARTAARYKNKKEISGDKGKITVYEYSDRQIQRRNREKAKKVEKLRKNLGKLCSKVKKDLASKDTKTWLTALAVGLIDETYERVGNQRSAKNGHFGVTVWQARHVMFSGNKATISYVGKSGVRQRKVVEDPLLVKALKRALKGKSGKDPVFEVDGVKVCADDVNAYLKPLGITAKDIRGLHANKEVQKRLKEIRSKSDLPEDRKKKEKQLQSEFKEALEGAAAAVGHKPETLRRHYLVPNLEESYLKDGTILSRLDKKGGAAKPGSRGQRQVRQGPFIVWYRPVYEDRLPDVLSGLRRVEALFNRVGYPIPNGVPVVLAARGWGSRRSFYNDAHGGFIQIVPAALGTKETLATFVHELAHYIHYKKLGVNNSAIRAQFQAVQNDVTAGGNAVDLAQEEMARVDKAIGTHIRKRYRKGTLMTIGGRLVRVHAVKGRGRRTQVVFEFVEPTEDEQTRGIAGMTMRVPALLVEDPDLRRLQEAWNQAWQQLEDARAAETETSRYEAPGAKWLPTTYSGKDEKEWFAELVTTRVLAPQALDEGVLSWLDSVVKTGRGKTGSRMPRTQYHATSWERAESILRERRMRLPRPGEERTFRHAIPTISTTDKPEDAWPWYGPALIELRVKGKYLSKSVRQMRRGESILDAVLRWSQEALDKGAAGFHINEYQNAVGNQTVDPRALEVVRLVNPEDAPEGFMSKKGSRVTLLLGDRVFDVLREGRIWTVRDRRNKLTYDVYWTNAAKKMTERSFASRVVLSPATTRDEEDVVFPIRDVRVEGPGMTWTYGEGTQLKASAARVVRRFMATKEPYEIEDEEIRRTLRRSPKKKPPRHDLRRRRIRERDPDEPTEAEKRKDRRAFRVATEWMIRETLREFLAGEDEKSFEDKVQESAKKEYERYREEHPDTELGLDHFVEKAKERLKRQEPEEREQQETPEPESKNEGAPDESQLQVREMERAFRSLVENATLPESVREDLGKRLKGMSPDEQKKMTQAFSATIERLKNNPPSEDRRLDFARQARNAKLPDDPQEAGVALADKLYAENVVFNPANIGDTPVSEDGEMRMTDADMQRHEEARHQRAVQAFQFARQLTDAEKQEMADRISKELEKVDPLSKRGRELLAVYDGIALSNLVVGEDPPVIGHPEYQVPNTPSLKALAKALHETGKESLLLGAVEKLTSPEGRMAVRDALGTLDISEMSEFVAEDSPLSGILQRLREDAAETDPRKKLPAKVVAEFRKTIADAITDSITLLDPLVGEYQEDKKAEKLSAKEIENSPVLRDLLDDIVEGEPGPEQEQEQTTAAELLKKLNKFRVQRLAEWAKAIKKHWKHIPQTPRAQEIWLRIQTAIKEGKPDVLDQRIVSRLARTSLPGYDFEPWTDMNR